MRLTVLGTSTPYPRPGNACSGYLLQSEVAGGAAGTGEAAAGERTSVWIDAGTGTLAELQRHLDPADLDAIWISHRHADHTADLLVAYYALRFAERRPEHPIPLIGPEGLLDRMAAFLGPSSVSELPRVFDFQAMSGWSERTIGALRLEWGPVQHGVPAFGLAVDDGATRFAYSGDSAPCVSLEELAEGAGTLLVEVGYDEGRGEDDDAPAHHTPEDAGRTAAASGVSRVVLTHIVESVTPAEAVARASVHFAGETIAASPGDVFAV